jgi:hypothetical protein
MTFEFEKAIYYFLMILMSAIILFSIGFVYLSANGTFRKELVLEELRRAEEAGMKKELPEFMLETLKSDELEQLKP